MFFAEIKVAHIDEAGISGFVATLVGNNEGRKEIVTVFAQPKILRSLSSTGAGLGHDPGRVGVA